MPAPPKKPTIAVKPPIAPASSAAGGQNPREGGLQGDGNGQPPQKKAAPKKECKLTPKQIGQLVSISVLGVFTVICAFFALDFRRIGQITQKIMRSPADHNITYAYYKMDETWKSLVRAKFKGSLFTYTSLVMDPRILLDVKCTIDGQLYEETNAPFKLGLWFCSSGDFQRIYRRFVQAVEMENQSVTWLLPQQNPSVPITCTMRTFKQLKGAPEKICWLQIHDSGRDDEVDKKNLAVYVPLVMSIGFFLMAVVLTVWALQKPEQQQSKSGVRKLNKNLAAATGASVLDNQDEKRNDPRADMIV